ncbi:hypothetical protein P3S68_014688 [Capsicum galapagoense]
MLMRRLLELVDWDRFSTEELLKDLAKQIEYLQQHPQEYNDEVKRQSERSDDMFCDDIFGESPTAITKKGKGDGLPTERNCLHDNWNDPEGYYCKCLISHFAWVLPISALLQSPGTSKFDFCPSSLIFAHDSPFTLCYLIYHTTRYRFGEILDGRYEILAAHGKGVFSTVVRAKDFKARLGQPEEVAIKIIRNNEMMYKAGMAELVILKKLVAAYPEGQVPPCSFNF